MSSFELPELIEIEPIHSCNLRCIMCHVSYEKLTNTRLDVDQLFKNLCNVDGKTVILGATHEPAMHPRFADLVMGLSERGANIEITTNGTALTFQTTDRIKDCRFRNITISFDGIKKETCESIRRNLNYTQALERILYFKKAISSDPYFVINYTVMKRNIGEMVDAVKFWDANGFDNISFIVMVIRDKIIKNESLQNCMPDLYEQLEKVSRYVIENNCKLNVGSSALAGVTKLRETYPDYFFSNIVKSKNPLTRLVSQSRDIQRGHFPGMPVACRSPFTFARILYGGEVQLCMKFVIGNIYEESFEKIWFGPRAVAVRSRLMNNPEECYRCEYYRFCIKASEIDLENEKNFYIDRVGINQRVYPSILVEGYRGFNIISYQDRIYAILQSEGTFDIDRINNNGYSRSVVGTSVEKVQQLIDLYEGNSYCLQPILLVENYRGLGLNLDWLSKSSLCDSAK